MSEPTQDVKFLPGIRQDVDRLSAPPGTLIDAQNVRYSISNGISGRNGTKTVPGTLAFGSLSAGNIIGIVDRLPGSGVFGVSSSTSTALPELFSHDLTRSRSGSLGYHSRSAPVKRRGVISPNGAASFGSSRFAVAANTLGYVMFCGSSGVNASGIQFLVQDPYGASLLNVLLTPATKASCIALGTRMVLVYQDGTSLLAINFDFPASGSLTYGLSGFVVGTLTSSSAFWDICPDATAANWYLVFQNGAATIRADRFAAGATTSNANNTTACTGTVPISAHHTTTGLWIGYYNDPAAVGSMSCRVANSDLSGFVAAAFVITTVGTAGKGPPLIGVQESAVSPATPRVIVSRVLGSGVDTKTGTLTTSSGSVGTLLPGIVAISKPTPLGQFWAVTGSPVTNCSYQRATLVSVLSANMPDLVMPETERSNVLYMPASNGDMFGTVATLPNGNSLFLVPELLQRSGAASLSDAIRLSLVEYEASAIYKDTVSGSTLITSGQPVEVPGMSDALNTFGAAEVGFLDRLYVLTATQQNSASGVLTALATYSWIFVIEWVDSSGRRHRSAPSTPYTLTMTGANDAVDFSLCFAPITGRTQYSGSMGPRVVLYRTIANQPDVFYRESAPLGGIIISTSVALPTFTAGNDAAATDAVIAANERLYTDGGVRSNAIAPSCRYLCESEDRVWCGGLWDPRVIQASKIIVPGEPLQFTDDFAFQVVIPDEVTGLAYLDGNVVAFCSSAIYVVSGEGPNDQGAGSFSSPRAICRDLGCIDFRSIVETSIGVLFQSTRGIYLLPRGLGNPVFVGMAVQDIMSAQVSGFTRVLGATSSQDSLNRLVRFLVENPTNSTTRVLAYDIDVAQTDPLAGWSYDTFSSRLSCIGNWPTGTLMSLYDLSSSTICGYLDETAATFLTDASNTQNITSAIQTADLRYAGLAGQWRCDLVIGVMSAPTTGATVTITVTCDDLTPDAVAWALTTATGSFYRQVTPAQPQCTAANVRFSCVRTAVLGPNYHGMTVELQPQPGARRTNSAER